MIGTFPDSPAWSVQCQSKSTNILFWWALVGLDQVSAPFKASPYIFHIYKLIFPVVAHAGLTLVYEWSGLLTVAS